MYLIAIILSESNHNTEEGYLGTPRLRPTQHSVFTPYGGLSTLIDNSTARHLPSSMEPRHLVTEQHGFKRVVNGRGYQRTGWRQAWGGDRQAWTDLSTLLSTLTDDSSMMSLTSAVPFTCQKVMSTPSPHTPSQDAPTHYISYASRVVYPAPFFSSG